MPESLGAADLEQVREVVRRVCAQFDDAYWRRCDREHEFPHDFYAAMAAGGWIGVAIPEEYGEGGTGSPRPPSYSWRSPHQGRP